MTTIEDAVRAWARGICATEAGAELLIRQERTIHEGAPWLTDLESPDPTAPRMVAIDVDTLLKRTGAYSGGESRVIRIAASLLGGPAVDLAEDVPGLDREHAALVLAAIAHANGSHQQSAIQFNKDGSRVDVTQMPALYSWPAL